MCFLGSTAVPSLAALKQRGHKMVNEHHLYKDQDLDLDLLPHALTINRENLLSSLATLKQRTQKIFSGQLILGLQIHQTTERLKTTYKYQFFKGGHKKTSILYERGVNNICSIQVI